MPPEPAKRALDIEYVLARALLVFGDASVVVDWLRGIEQTLGFGEPLLTLAHRGADPLLKVLDRIEADSQA